MTYKEANAAARKYSRQYGTFWYVREVTAGDFQPYAHDSDDASTLACFYAGKPWNPITSEQLAALQVYASAHGHEWKAKLRSDWLHCRLVGTLHALRNTHGPSWLVTFKL